MASSRRSPYDPVKNTLASATDPHTWGSYEATKAYCSRTRIGIGFVFAKNVNGVDDGLTGIDLDDCITGNGEVEPWAKKIIELLNSYTEISPSGTGVKILIRARKGQELERCRKGGIEIYDNLRFFTVTGNHLVGTPTTIEARQAELEQLYGQLFTEMPTPPAEESVVAFTRMSDEEVLARARSARNGELFERLFLKGDIAGYDSGSEADLALCSLLAFWTGPNPAQIDRLFRKSKLVDTKWTTRKDYRERTISKVLEGRTEFFKGKSKVIVAHMTLTRKQGQEE